MLKELVITSMNIKTQAVAFNFLAVPQKTSHNISMKKVINEQGFRTAMRAGKTWTTLDCQLSETAPGRWNWEIEKTVFHNKDGVTELIGHGSDINSLETVTRIWDNLIEKYTPDEYFVDQYTHKRYIPFPHKD